jgi:hypothetical protein
MHHRTRLAQASEQRHLPLLAVPCDGFEMSAKSCRRGRTQRANMAQWGSLAQQSQTCPSLEIITQTGINQDDFEIEQNNYTMTDK